MSTGYKKAFYMKKRKQIGWKKLDKKPASIEVIMQTGYILCTFS